ncbi:MAG: hypothetical protein ABIZ36_06335 [Gemmatimonadaceae bacterium]
MPNGVTLNPTHWAAGDMGDVRYPYDKTNRKRGNRSPYKTTVRVDRPRIAVSPFQNKRREQYDSESIATHLRESIEQFRQRSIQHQIGNDKLSNWNASKALDIEKQYERCDQVHTKHIGELGFDSQCGVEGSTSNPDYRQRQRVYEWISEARTQQILRL